jgi:hypothetical protein
MIPFQMCLSLENRSSRSFLINKNMIPVSNRVNTAETPTTEMTKRINSFMLLLASQGVHFTPKIPEVMPSDQS